MSSKLFQMGILNPTVQMFIELNLEEKAASRNSRSAFDNEKSSEPEANLK